MDAALVNIQNKLNSSDLSKDLKDHLIELLGRLQKAFQSGGYKLEYDKELEYLEFIVSLPFNRSSADILDLKRAASVLDKNHYGLQVAKDRILEYLSVLILNQRQNIKLRSQVLAFVGLVGSGKTSLAYSIAESLGRKIIRIPFGGLGSVKDLRGESRINPQAEPGKLLRQIAAVGVNNPVILLDEIDRVAQETKNDVMGVLVELLDPEQNWAFVDKYVDYPFDLSKALFIATANNTGNIATAVMDRLEVIEMPSYSDDEKIMIGKHYLLPKALTEVGLSQSSVIMDDALWPHIVRPLGYDGGIRSLQRHINQIVRIVARKVVEGGSGQFNLNDQNIAQFLH